MPTESRKCKTISLRVTESEYETLHTRYPAYGARNISDFARLAMQRVMENSPVSDGAVAAKIHELENRLRAAEANIVLLEQRGRAKMASPRSVADPAAE